MIRGTVVGHHRLDWSLKYSEEFWRNNLWCGTTSTISIPQLWNPSVLISKLWNSNNDLYGDTCYSGRLECNSFCWDEVKMDTRRSDFTQTLSNLERYCNVTLTFINDTWQRSVNALKNKAPQAPSPTDHLRHDIRKVFALVCTGSVSAPAGWWRLASAVNEPKTSCGDCRDEHIW